MGLLLRIAILAGLASLICAPGAQAHRAAAGDAGPEGGIVVPNLSHGQMIVIAANRDAIMDLAARQIPMDPVMRRLEGFINLQRFACLWGMVPGTLTDEDSPFNECAHAYLAASRSLLMHLREMPGDRTAVRALVTRIELEMLANQASLVLCRYSDEPFNTSEILGPHWSGIPAHAPTSVTFGGLTLALVGCGWLAVRRDRSIPSS